MSAPTKERPVDRLPKASSLASEEPPLEGYRKEILVGLCAMHQQLDNWTSGNGWREPSEERMGAFRDLIKAYRAALRYIDAVIRAEATL